MALISALSVFLPILNDFLSEDNSDISLTYVNDRGGITKAREPGIRASNKGKRPAFMHPEAMLDVTLASSNGKKTYSFPFSATSYPRQNLLIPENTSKLIYFNADETILYGEFFANEYYRSFYNDLEDSYKLEKCVFTVIYTDFSGNEYGKDFVIFDSPSHHSVDDSYDGLTQWLHLNSCNLHGSFSK